MLLILGRVLFFFFFKCFFLPKSTTIPGTALFWALFWVELRAQTPQFWQILQTKFHLEAPPPQRHEHKAKQSIPLLLDTTLRCQSVTNRGIPQWRTKATSFVYIWEMREVWLMHRFPFTHSITALNREEQISWNWTQGMICHRTDTLMIYRLFDLGEILSPHQHICLGRQKRCRN